MQCESSSSYSRFVLLLAWISLLIQFLLLAMMNSSDHYSKQILAKLISTWRWLFSLLVSFFNGCYVSNGLLGDEVSFLTGTNYWLTAQFVQAKKKEICMEITDARCCIFRACHKTRACRHLGGLNDRPYFKVDHSDNSKIRALSELSK